MNLIYTSTHIVKQILNCYNLVFLNYHPLWKLQYDKVLFAILKYTIWYSTIYQSSNMSEGQSSIVKIMVQINTNNKNATDAIFCKHLTVDDELN